MEDLHAAIANYLRCQRRPLAREEAAILDIWRERGDVPRCRVCGAVVDDDDGLHSLADMRSVRECHLHYTPF